MMTTCHVVQSLRAVVWKTVESEICQMAAVKICGNDQTHNAQVEEIQIKVGIPSFIARRLENQEIQG